VLDYRVVKKTGSIFYFLLNVSVSGEAFLLELVCFVSFLLSLFVRLFSWSLIGASAFGPLPLSFPIGWVRALGGELPVRFCCC
jgi:hypothetical protein